MKEIENTIHQDNLSNQIKRYKEKYGYKHLEEVSLLLYLDIFYWLR